MKSKFLVIFVASLSWACLGSAAEQTLSGKISDSSCGAAHQTTAEHGKKMSDRACTLACIKKGSKFVVVSDGKVYNVANQEFAGLTKHAGHNVKVTGDIDGDTITVSKITM